MQRRTLLGVIALIAVTVACTRPEVTATTEPLAPPDSFAPSTTVTTQARTTTTVDVERASIYRVDPLTLVPLEGFEPIPMGDWFWGTTSENGSWLALNVGQDNLDRAELRLIDLDTWATVASWSPVPVPELHVAEDGAIYTLVDGSSSLLLERLTVGEDEATIIADLPPGFSWNQFHLQDRLALILGSKGSNPGEASLITVDLETGAVIEISLFGFDIGTIEEVDIGEDYSGFVNAHPALVSDGERARVLIVHANQDVVTEVNLATGEMTEHQFGSEASSWGRLFAWLVPPAHAGGMPLANKSRMAVLGPDGRSLYVATTLGEFEVTDDAWSVTTLATGIITVDTVTWQIVDRLDAPISSISLSPDGGRLLATGYNNTYGEGTLDEEAFGAYVIDPVGLEVIAHHGADEPSRYYGEFSFSRDSQYGYATSWDQYNKIEVVDLETGAILTTREGESQSQIFGDVAVLGGLRP